MPELRYFAAATRGDIEPGEVFITDVEGTQVALCNVDGEFFAIEDMCTHDGSSFDMTELDGPEIFCPRHGAVFDVRDGSALAMPASRPVPTFPVRMNGDVIEVGMEV